MRGGRGEGRVGVVMGEGLWLGRGVCGRMKGVSVVMLGVGVGARRDG